METRNIFNIGNSLAVVIPVSLVEQLQLKKGDTVAWVNGAIVKVVEVTK
jgi:antitoxin component of MazEF toxin-antitoxin module